jgi:hypothetical protein
VVTPEKAPAVQKRHWAKRHQHHVMVLSVFLISCANDPAQIVLSTAMAEEDATLADGFPSRHLKIPSG